MNESLAAHYDALYAREPQADRASQLVVPGRVPRNRFEACVRGLPRLFAGGDVLELDARLEPIAERDRAREVDAE